MFLASIDQLRSGLQYQIKRNMELGIDEQASGNLLVAHPGMGMHTILKEGARDLAMEQGRAFVDLGAVKDAPQAVDPEAVVFWEITADELAEALACSGGAHSQAPRATFSDATATVGLALPGQHTLERLQGLSGAKAAVLVVDMKGSDQSAVDAAMAFQDGRKVEGLDLSRATVFLSQSHVGMKNITTVRLNSLNAFVLPGSVQPTGLADILDRRRAADKSDAGPKTPGTGCS